MPKHLQMESGFDEDASSITEVGPGKRCADLNSMEAELLSHPMQQMHGRKHHWIFSVVACQPFQC
jgi:hypothetical protein